MASLNLHLVQEPPAQPFVNAEIKLRVALVDSTDGHQHSGMVLPLKVDLVQEDGTPIKARKGKIVDVAVGRGGRGKVEINSTTGDVVLSITVNETSVLHNNQAFFIRISPAKSASTVKPVTSAVGMNVIKYKFKISNVTGLERDPKNGNALFFKDEGGREKMVSVHGALVDKDGKPVAGFSGANGLPLAVQLTYADGAPVRNTATCLKVKNPGQVIGADGAVVVQFRLEDVSKNHGGQGFCVQIAHDVQRKPDVHGIGAAMAAPIIVRSKRNKKKPKGGKRVAEAASSGPQRKRQAMGAFAVPAPRSSSSHAQETASIRSAALADVEAGLAIKTVVEWTANVVRHMRTTQALLAQYDGEVKGMLGTVMEIVHQSQSQAQQAQLPYRFAPSAAASVSAAARVSAMVRASSLGSVQPAGLLVPPALEPMRSSEGASAATPRTAALLEQTVQSMLRASSAGEGGAADSALFDGLDRDAAASLTSLSQVAPMLRRQTSAIFMEIQSGQAFVTADAAVVAVHCRKLENLGMPAFDASDAVRLLLSLALSLSRSLPLSASLSASSLCVLCSRRGLLRSAFTSVPPLTLAHASMSPPTASGLLLRALAEGGHSLSWAAFRDALRRGCERSAHGWRGRHRCDRGALLK